MVHKSGSDYSEKNIRLAYKFNIYAEQPLYRSYVFIDANTGEVIAETPIIHTNDVVGTANTKYSGSVTMTSDNFGTNQYRLQETGRGNGIATYNLGNSVSYLNTDFTNNSSNWNTTGADQAATDAHWGAEMTYDYFQQIHTRNSIDGNGLPLLSYVHYDINYPNAFWDGQVMTYGDGDVTHNFDIMTGLDVCGHEITHGLTQFTAGLSGGEGDALNEGFSDIFGTTIEFYSRPTQHDWLMGAEITLDHHGIRDMSNPANLGQPNCYLGTNWDPNDEPHNNNGPAIYWYYLLCQGGSGTNDFGSTYNITGITMAEARLIAFRGLTNYMTPGSSYMDARTSTIQAATDIYGACSPEVITTTNAWYAVGVGDVFTGNVYADFSATPNSFCSTPASVNFINNSLYGSTYYWDFGDGSNSTLENPSHIYLAQGAYTITLQVHGTALCNTADTLTLNNYINVGNFSVIASASDSSVCSGKNFNLSTPFIGGVTLQWQSSPTGASGTFTDILGATNSTYSTSQTTTTYYQCVAICNGGTPVISNSLNITMNPITDCYCIPSLTNCNYGDVITNVTIATINNTTACSSNGYSFYNTPVPTLYQSSTYPIAVTVGSGGTEYVAAWIDYNHNGTFETNEFTSIGNGTGATINSSITIPANALPGNTIMRVRVSYNNPLSDTSACSEYAFGETEDYSVAIVMAQPCSGIPTPGTASASVNPVCSGTNFNLVLTGYTTGVSGLTFQWQKSATGAVGSFTNISGANTPTYATTQTSATYYQCIVTCSGGTPVISNIINVSMNSTANCICIPSTDCSYDDVITNVTMVTINNTTTCSTNGYSFYMTPVPTLHQSFNYPIAVTVGPGGTEYVAAWIDYNQNGTFEASEFTSIGSGTGVTINSSISIPGTALSGNTTMRVRVSYNNPLTDVDACLDYSYGETEDYSITIGGTVGINENTLNGISIYPNPTTGIFNVTMNNANCTELMINVFDIQGKEVFNSLDKNISSNYNKQIHLENLAKGIYYIKLNTNNAVKIQKLIIQ
jgi:Zn-dependent metalloprotease